MSIFSEYKKVLFDHARLNILFCFQFKLKLVSFFEKVLLIFTNKFILC